MISKDFDEIAAELKRMKEEEFLRPEDYKRVVFHVMGACKRLYKGSYGFNKEKFLRASGLEI
jgi:hypothetical protein